MPERTFHLCPIAWHVLFTLCLPALLSAQSLVVHTESEAEALNDLLRDLEGISLDLNRASAKDLLVLPDLTPDLAQQITAQRPYHTIKDLARVPGLSEDQIDAIAPYLSIAPSRPWRSNYTTRISRPSNRPNSLDEMRLYQRFQLTTPNGISGFFLTERDPQEPDLADHLTGYITIPLNKMTLTLGDMRPQWGQGLIFSRRTRTATGLSLARPPTSSQPGNRTSTEYGALSGIHLTGTYSHLTWACLYGQTMWDASFAPGEPARLHTTGLHDTETARLRKNTLHERLAAAHFTLGSAHHYLEFAILNTSFKPTAPAQHSPWHYSINGQWRTDHLALFGEFAPKASLAGLVAGTSILRLHLIARRYDAQFYSLHGAPFAAYGNPPNNEWGIFTALVWRLSPKNRIELSLDRHGRLISTHKTLPARGERFRLDLNHRITTSFSIRLTTNSKRATAQLPRRSLRISLTYRRSNHRFIIWNQIARSGTFGHASGVRLNLGQTTGFSLALWTTIHAIASYDARIYDFEPDVWGGTRLLTLSGRGLNRGIRLAWSKKHIRLATRYSHHRTSSWSAQLDLRR